MVNGKEEEEEEEEDCVSMAQSYVQGVEEEEEKRVKPRVYYTCVPNENQREQEKW